MGGLTVRAAQQLDDEAITRSVPEIAAYLQDAVGQRVAAAMLGLADAKQIGRYSREDGPEPHATTERRLQRATKSYGCSPRPTTLKRLAPGCSNQQPAG